MKFPTDVQNVLVVARNLNARDAVARRSWDTKNRIIACKTLEQELRGVDYQCSQGYEANETTRRQ